MSAPSPPSAPAVPLNVRLRIVGGRSSFARRLFATALNLRDRWFRVVQAGDIARFGEEVEVETEGVRLRLRLRDYRDFRMYRHLRAGRPTEPGTAGILRATLRPGGVVVDAGANNGLFSLIAASLVGPSGRVHAFEPHPAAYERLKANVRANGFSQVSAYPLALSNRTGRAFLAGALDDGMSSLKATGGTRFEVPLETLDRAIGPIPVDLVKIDVEGSELEVLEGMTALFARNPGLRLLVEWNRSYAAPTLFDFLRRKFDVFRVDDSTGSAWRLTPVAGTEEFPSLCNLFCVPHAPG